MQNNGAAGFTREDTKVVKAVAVILMYIYHLFAFPERLEEGVSFISLGSVGGTQIEMLVGEFGNICVPMFTFLAGYGTYLSCRGKKSEELLPILGRKILGLYKLFWTVFIVFIPLCVVFEVPYVAITLRSLLGNLTALYPYYTDIWWFLTPYLMLLVFYPVLHQISGRFHTPFSEFLAVVLCNTFAVYILPVISSYAWIQRVADSFVYGKAAEAALRLSQFWMGVVFAKYDLLSILKKRLCGNALYSLTAVAVMIISVDLRIGLTSSVDFILVPVYTVCIVVALNHKLGRGIREILVHLGKESTFLWLTHPFYYSYLCHRLVYAPKYSVLILIWLLLMCFVTAKLLRLLMKAMGWGWKKVSPFIAVTPLDS